MPSKLSKCFFFENFNGGSISAIYNKTTSLKNYVTILRFFNSTYLSEKDLYNFEFVSTITIQNDKESWILISLKTIKWWTKVLSRILVFLCVSKEKSRKISFWLSLFNYSFLPLFTNTITKLDQSFLKENMRIKLSSRQTIT